MKYNIKNEYINISNYSPFSHINEVSKKYQKNPFMLPIVNIDNSIVPIHPDTFNDLKISIKRVLFYIKVYPTASFRTVYYKDKNIFIKLPILRKITRGIRNLPNKELMRSEQAKKILSKINIKYFNYLDEIPIYNNDDNYNYIIRLIPNKKLTPLFTIIKQKRISKEKITLLIKRMIDIWLQLAKQKIYLEFHTQNILIDCKYNIYYRDLSDVRSLKYDIKPSYKTTDINLMTLSFDKTFCMQNLEHIFNSFSYLDKEYFIKYIKKRIEYYKLKFPNYSLIYNLKESKRIPVKIKKIEYR